MDDNKDRTCFQPSHRGDNILPNTAFLAQLLRHAHRGRIAIRDDNAGIERTYTQLVADALSLRKQVSEALSADTRAALDHGEEVFVGVLAPGGYAYAVAVIAVYALGAAVVPMTVALPAHEAVYFVEKSRQVAIVASSDAMSLAGSAARRLSQSRTDCISVVNVDTHLSHKDSDPSNFLISSDRHLDENGAGLVIFTSGTTGPPKGAVHRRGFITEETRAVAEHYQIGPRDVLLHVLPVHHATGAMINFFPFLASGACIEFRSGSFDPDWMWRRWRRRDLTFFSGVPTIYMRMMRYYEQHLAKMPIVERQPFEEGANSIKVMMCGTSALPRPVQHFWTQVRGGKIIHTRYGSTEAGAIFKVPLDPKGVPDGSVGEVAPGVDVRLSEGDEATAAAFDVNGYFETGDIASRVGRFYWIVGRASQDIIKSGGYKISALDVERECLSLPYIAEVMCVGVEDEDLGQRVGAVLSLRDDQDTYVASPCSGKTALTLDLLRRDLSLRIARYKMPTLLRVVEGELPKTASGKVLKRVLGPQLLPSPQWKTIDKIHAWYPKTTTAQAKL
ncbi:MAG: hypothetical protein Q9159_005459 [Coniocarpon cinnabarinum]